MVVWEGFDSAESFDPEIFHPELATEGLVQASGDEAFKADSFRGWKPLPRAVDTYFKFITLS